MANHKSALKQHRQSTVRRLRNHGHKSRMRTAVKKFRVAVAGGELDAARALLAPTLGMIDRTVKLGLLHRNSAARTKSRLTIALNRAAAS